MSGRKYFVKHKYGTGILILWLLSGCAPEFTPAATNESISDPFACQTGAEPRPDAEFSHFSPDCSCVTSTSTGMTWHGLTVGQSTLEDVQSVLDAQGVQSSQDNGWQFDDIHEPRIWWDAEACFVEEKLSVLFIGVDLDLGRIGFDQLLEQYGDPDRVTWGTNYGNRVLIWSEKGLLVFVAAAGGTPGSIVLFPPIPPESLETSWLMASLPDGPVGSPDADDVILEGEWPEDPWGIGKLNK
jgi:hypothetical protein